MRAAILPTRSPGVIPGKSRGLYERGPDFQPPFTRYGFMRDMPPLRNPDHNGYALAVHVSALEMEGKRDSIRRWPIPRFRECKHPCARGREMFFAVKQR